MLKAWKIVVFLSLLWLSASAQMAPSHRLRPTPFANPHSINAVKHPISVKPSVSATVAPGTPPRTVVPTVAATLSPVDALAHPPRISYQGGLLTVVAENSGLADVLSGIHAATGVQIDGNNGGNGERVAAKIGPASVHDVLLSLLEGSRYDFVLLGSPIDSTKVDRVLLSAKLNLGSPSIPAPAQNSSPANADAEATQDQVNNDTEDDDNAGFAAPAVAAAPANGEPTVKTPEQLLEDLKKLEADREQQQNNPANPNNPRPSRPERPK